GGFDTHLSGSEGFIASISPEGEPLWSSYLKEGTGNGVAADRSGYVVVAGSAFLPNKIDFGYNTDFKGGSDAFVTRITTNPTGALRVTLSPSIAAQAATGWHRVGETAWHSSGETVVGLDPGVHKVEFRSAPGWFTPLTRNVAIVASQT